MTLCFSFNRCSPREKMVAHCERVSLQFFAVDHFQHRFALRGDDRVAAESVEVNPLRERGGDLRRGHDRA